MSYEDYFVTEQCGSGGESLIYKKRGSNTIECNIRKPQTFTTSVFQTIYDFFCELILPQGYPDSVSDDYFAYQLWDTIQAFCSTITGIFTTQAVLKGVGVGNAAATALSATITWILKDGTGMIGRIIFAWWKGNALDCNCKKWRLFADFMNDSAMILEMCVPFFEKASTGMLCFSTAMKSVVGVAGGATRASITNHQAIKGNMAEISAKDGSQETVVNLIASVTGLFLLNICTSITSQWAVTISFMILHLYSNYRAVTSLIFKNFNNARLSAAIKQYLELNTVSKPETVNKWESVIVGMGGGREMFCGFKIYLGKSLKKVLTHSSMKDIEILIEAHKNNNYLIIPNRTKKAIFVSFEKGETSKDVIAAYFHAVLLILAIRIYNNESLEFDSKKQLHHSSPISRLDGCMKNYSNYSESSSNLTLEILLALNSFVRREKEMFFSALEINGWRVDNHSILMDQWRVDWKISSKKTS